MRARGRFAFAPQAIRRAGRVTAQHYLWPQILSGILLPRLRLLAALSPHEATLEHGEEPWRQRRGALSARGASGNHHVRLKQP